MSDSRHLRETQLGCGMVGVVSVLALAWSILVNSYLVVYAIDRDAFPLMDYANHGAHWLTLGNIILLGLVLIFARRRWLMGALLPGVIMFGVWYGVQWIPRSDPNFEGTPLTVVTFNVQGNQGDPAQLYALIASFDVDFIALEEIQPTLQAQLADGLADDYPYQADEILEWVDGLMLLSKYPFLEEPVGHVAEPDQPGARYIRALIDIKGQAVAIYVFHPPKPNGRKSINLGQTEQVRDMVKAETVPTLVLCDCNNTPRSTAYATLDSVLIDSHMERGFGFGLTFPAGKGDWGFDFIIPTEYTGPLLRLDYIWHTSEFVTLDSHVWVEGEGGSSDHFPLYAELVLKPE